MEFTLHRIKEGNKLKPIGRIIQQLEQIGYIVSEDHIKHATEKTQTRYMNKEDIIDIASKYQYKEDFIKENSSIYRFLVKSNLTDYIDFLPKRSITYTEDAILKIISTLSTQEEMYKNYHGAYLCMYRNKFLRCADAYRNLKGKSKANWAVSALDFDN